MDRLKHLKAYVVDDDEVELYLIQRIIKLKQLAESVEVFRNGNELIEALKNAEVKPDYILLNYRMVSETGLEVLKTCQELKLKQPNVAPFFILTSSTSDLSDLETIMKDENIDGFLYKPLVAKKLRERLIPLFK